MFIPQQRRADLAEKAVDGCFMSVRVEERRAQTADNDGSDGLSDSAPLESQGVRIVQIPGSFPGQTEHKGHSPLLEVKRTGSLRIVHPKSYNPSRDTQERSTVQRLPGTSLTLDNFTFWFFEH